MKKYKVKSNQCWFFGALGIYFKHFCNFWKLYFYKKNGIIFYFVHFPKFQKWWKYCLKASQNHHLLDLTLYFFNFISFSDLNYWLGVFKIFKQKKVLEILQDFDTKLKLKFWALLVGKRSEAKVGERSEASKEGEGGKTESLSPSPFFFS